MAESEHFTALSVSAAVGGARFETKAKDAALAAQLGSIPDQEQRIHAQREAVGLANICMKCEGPISKERRQQRPYAVVCSFCIKKK